MRIGIIVLFFVHLTITGQSQDFPSEMWHNGKLVLLSQDTIIGKIKYDLKNDIIQINIKNALQTYSARKIFYFEIFDETIDSYRHFYSLPYNVQPNYKVPLLFEVLYEGQLSLLCREEVVTESAPQYNSYPYSSYYGNNSYNQTRTRLSYKYYFFDERGGIQDYNMKKNELLTFFKKHQQQVKQYIKKNNLKPDKMSDLVRLTAYYNALLDS